MIFCFSVLSGCEKINARKYEKAHKLYSQGKLIEAADIFASIRDYKDCYQLAADCYFEAGDFDSAEGMYLYLSKDGDQKNTYKKAVCNYELNDYTNAAYSFESVLDYSNASEYLAKIYVKTIADAQINDVVKFGRYEQDADESNGKETIEWNVLKKEETRVLLISDMILDYQPYNIGNKLEGGAISLNESFISWENSYIRTWLNNTFKSCAFSEAETNIIIETLLTTENDILPTCITRDKVFILSANEFYEYTKNATVGTMNQIATVFAKKQRAQEDCWNACYTRNQKPNSGLFGLSDVCSPGVIEKGTVYYLSASHKIGAIRPCIWIDISKVD